MHPDKGLTHCPADDSSQRGPMGLREPSLSRDDPYHRGPAGCFQPAVHPLEPYKRKIEKAFPELEEAHQEVVAALHRIGRVQKRKEQREGREAVRRRAAAVKTKWAAEAQSADSALARVALRAASMVASAVEGMYALQGQQARGQSGAASETIPQEVQRRFTDRLEAVLAAMAEYHAARARLAEKPRQDQHGLYLSTDTEWQWLVRLVEEEAFAMAAGGLWNARGLDDQVLRKLTEGRFAEWMAVGCRDALQMADRAANDWLADRASEQKARRVEQTLLGLGEQLVALSCYADGAPAFDELSRDMARIGERLREATGQ